MVEVREVQASAGDFGADHDGTFLLPKLEVGVCSIFLVKVSMDLKDPPGLDFVLGRDPV
jgi:hypothetical protein